MNNVFENTATTRQSSSDKEKDASRLLELLLDKRRKELEPRSALDTILPGRFFTSQENFNDSDMMIQELIERLIDNTSGSEQNRYDPTTCLLGPLYATLYSYTPNANTAPDPLWKRISIFSAQNIQGQQYYQDESTQQKVVNYSEIFGSSLYLEARGSFTESVMSDDDKEANDRNLLDSFWAAAAQSSGLRTCPDSYDVTVTQASFCFGKKKKFNVPIQGQSILRVLYASPQLRIFVSPLDNTDEAGTQWETSGLIVVQVRSDLLPGVAEPLDIR